MQPAYRGIATRMDTYQSNHGVTIITKYCIVMCKRHLAQHYKFIRMLDVDLSSHIRDASVYVYQLIKNYVNARLNYIYVKSLE